MKTKWVCQACGREASERMKVGDESCYLHAVLVDADSIKHGPDGRVTHATAVPEIQPIEDGNLPKSAPDFDFITDRLAVGNVASRAVPGFAAVVSLLATKPWDELYGAPRLPLDERGMPPLLHHIDINDGECVGQNIRDGRDLRDSLSEVTRFIAEGLARGCVLVHCGAGISRSVAVVCAYLCRYAGMRWDEALALVKSRRPCAAPANVFCESVTRWLQLDRLAGAGPRGSQQEPRR